MRTLIDKKSNLLMFLCWFAYTTAYVARLNYNASMVEILETLGTTKEAAGTVNSCFFFAYGVGQFVNGLSPGGIAPNIPLPSRSRRPASSIWQCLSAASTA